MRIAFLGHEEDTVAELESAIEVLQEMTNVDLIYYFGKPELARRLIEKSGVFDDKTDLEKIASLALEESTEKLQEWHEKNNRMQVLRTVKYLQGKDARYAETMRERVVILSQDANNFDAEDRENASLLVSKHNEETRMVQRDESIHLSIGLAKSGFALCQYRKDFYVWLLNNQGEAVAECSLEGSRGKIEIRSS